MRKTIRILAVVLAIVMQINIEAHAQQQPSQVVSVGGGTSTGGTYSQFSVIGGGPVQSIVSGGIYSGEIGFLYGTKVEYLIPVAMDAEVDLDENSASGSPVHTVVAIDSDSEALSFSISGGNESGAFTIDALTGSITVADVSKLDYETFNSFTLKVTVDDGANSDEATITVNLINLNDNNPVASNATIEVNENTATGSLIHTLAATDADNDVLIHSITAGNTAGAFSIDETTGAITVADASQLDYEAVTSFVLGARVSDGTRNTDITITINLNNLPDNSPVAQDHTVELEENSINGTAVHTVVATNPENGVLTYRISAGNGSGAFALNASTGAITVADASKLDYELTRTFSLTVNVSDGTTSDDATLTVNLKDLNDNNPVAEDVTVEVNENLAVGTLVHKVVASDKDGNALTFSITAGNDSGAFSIDSEGNIKVADAAKVDYETTTSFLLTVRVSDGVNTDEAVLTVNLKNINEDSPVAQDQTVDLDENSANGTLVHTVAATDTENDVLSYAIIAGNESSAFAIDETSGAITVANTGELDFETIKVFTLTVNVSDGVNSDDATIVVNLKNLNDNNPVAEEATVRIDENSAKGTVLHTMVATDADNDVLKYSITGGNVSDIFAVDSGTGIISVANSSPLDYEKYESFSLLLTVSDGTKTDDVVISVIVNNLNDIPKYWVSGNIVTPEGPALANGTVSLIRIHSASWSEVIQTVSLNGSGEFLFNDMLEGNYTLKISPTAPQSGLLPLLITYLGEVQLPSMAQSFLLNKNTNIPDVKVLRQFPIPQPMKGNSAISGILVEEGKGSGQGGRIMKGLHAAAGTPMAEAQVFLTDPETKEVVFSEVTDKDGKFTFQNIASRKYGFLVEYKGNSFEMPQAIDLSQENATVEVTAVVSENGVEATVEQVTAIEGEVRGELILFPNPLKEKLSIKIEDLTPGPLEIWVCDGHGKVLKRMQIDFVGGTLLKEVDFTGFPDGLYLISFRQTHSVVHKKVLKH